MLLHKHSSRIPIWDLEYIKSVLMLNIVINLVNKPHCFYWYKHFISICLCGFVETCLKSKTNQTCYKMKVITCAVKKKFLQVMLGRSKTITI